MEETKSKTFTTEEIKELAVEIQPILEKLTEIVQKYGMKGFISATAWDSGSSYLIGTGLNGWDIDRDADGFIKVSYNYTEKLELDKEVM